MWSAVFRVFLPVVIIIEIKFNNELEVFVQISKTDVRFGNDRGRRPRLLQNSHRSSISAQIPQNKLFISILL